MADEYSGFGKTASWSSGAVPLANIAEWSYRSLSGKIHDVSPLVTPEFEHAHTKVVSGRRIIKGNFIGYASASSPVNLLELKATQLELTLERGGVVASSFRMFVTITEVSEINDIRAARYRVGFTGGGIISNL